MRKLISVFGRIPVSVFVLGIAAPTYYFYFHTCHRWSKETSYSCLLARVNRTLEETAEEIRRDPKNADAWYDRGKAHAWKGEYGYAWQAWGEYDRALAAFSEAVRLNPKDTDAWRARGEILLKKREYDLAIDQYDQVIRLHPTYDDFVARGRIYVYKSDYDRAIADFSEAIRLDPNNFVAFGERGDAYSKKGDWTRSRLDFGETQRLIQRWLSEQNVLRKRVNE